MRRVVRPVWIGPHTRQQRCPCTTRSTVKHSTMMRSPREFTANSFVFSGFRVEHEHGGVCGQDDTQVDAAARLVEEQVPQLRDRRPASRLSSTRGQYRLSFLCRAQPNWPVQRSALRQRVQIFRLRGAAKSFTAAVVVVVAVVDRSLTPQNLPEPFGLDADKKVFLHTSQ